MTNAQKTKCGFVAVIGPPNAGKSTLINTFVGNKVSIVSPKVQTTRSIVRGIAMHNNCQIVFIDTPGLFTPKKQLEKAMVKAAWASQQDADFIMLVYDVSRKQDRDFDNILQQLKQNKTAAPCILVLNKIDKIAAEELLALSQRLNEAFTFEATFMVSATKARGTRDIMDHLSSRLPEGPYMYPEDHISDMPMRLLAAEITREKLFQKLYQELPYGLTVETENWEERDDGSVLINQAILVDRENHKPIILGKKGQLIKHIGIKAREELEEILGQKVHLKLFVKIQEDWDKNPEYYERWGLE